MPALLDCAVSQEHATAFSPSPQDAVLVSWLTTCFACSPCVMLTFAAVPERHASVTHASYRKKGRDNTHADGQRRQRKSSTMQQRLILMSAGEALTLVGYV
jgi:hypothetical protein